MRTRLVLSRVVHFSLVYFPCSYLLALKDLLLELFISHGGGGGGGVRMAKILCRAHKRVNPVLSSTARKPKLSVIRVLFGVSFAWWYLALPPAARCLQYIGQFEQRLVRAG